MAHICSDPSVQRIVDFFESMQLASVQRMGEFYTLDANFKDPFNEVRGLKEVQGIFNHMYVALHEPHFVVVKR